MRRRCFLICACAAVLLAGAIPIATRVAAESNRGWWVVLGSIAAPDNNFTPEVEAAVGRVEAAARPCGLQPFQDFSSKFSGFPRGYVVVVTGAYGSRARADQVLAKAKQCVPDVYLKQGSYAGE